MANVPQSPCVSFSIPAITLPIIFTPTPGLTLSFPPPPTLPDANGLPAIPCCKFTIPAFTPVIPLPPLPIGQLMAALNVLILAGLAILPLVNVPQCPL